MHAIAKLDEEDLQRLLLPQISASSQLQIVVDGAELPVPEPLRQLLVRGLAEFFAGQEITVTSDEVFLTTEQAAKLVGVSRPTLVRLLDKFQTPVSSTGSHRRIRLADVIVLQDQLRMDRADALNEIIEISEKSGLYELTDQGRNPLERD